MKFVDHAAGDQNANFVLDSCEKGEKDLDADGVMDKYSKHCSRSSTDLDHSQV